MPTVPSPGHFRPALFAAAAGLAIALLPAPAAAQTSAAQLQQMRAMQRGMPRNMWQRMMGEEIDFDSDEFEERFGGGAAAMFGGRAARTAAEPETTPKTDLGRKIKELDLDRDPAGVLAARAQLAAEAREHALRPPEPEPADEAPAAPAAAPAEPDGEVGGEADDEAAPEAPAGWVPVVEMPAMQLPPGMPPELLEMIGSDMARLMGGGGPPATKEDAALDKKAQRFRTLVLAGDWPAVAEFIRTEGGEDAVTIYNILLAGLATGDSAVLPNEVIAISDAAPADLTDWQITRLGMLLKSAQKRGCETGPLGVLIARGTRHFGGPDDPVKRGRAASLLVAAGLPVQAQAYLPPLEDARAAADAELLNLYVAYFRARAKTDQGEDRQAAITHAWETCLAVLAIQDAATEQRRKALRAGLALLREVPREDGDAWLASLFTHNPDLAWSAIESTNRRADMMRQMHAPADKRLDTLLVLNRLGRAALASDDPAWQIGLDMLSGTILQEAEATSKRGGDEETPFIPADQLAPAIPDARWLAAIDPGLAARLEVIAAATDGGAGEIQGVIEMIRPIAETDPERARKLAEALLKAWVNYVRPGSEDSQSYAAMMRQYARLMGGYNPYMYGMAGGAEGAIPLTRARQQRNLNRLGEVVAELRALGIDPLPTAALVEALAACYSTAEVFAAAEIERVLGPIPAIQQDAVLRLAQTMRERLASVWRSPQVQQRAGTRRTDKELAAEVLRGYTLALDLARAASAGAPDDWASALLVADLHFDHAEFLYGQKADLATYAAERDRAFAHYALAADLYSRALAAGRTQPSAKVFVQWFSSALGASDLGYLTRQDAPDLDQIESVRLAIDALDSVPGDGAARRHVGLFAQSITKAMEELNPELKPRFIRSACRIVGDHPDGESARRQLAFYDDLTGEVQLRITIDGSTDVGHADPFGAHLAIWCTRAVARESGGFGKYLANGAWNYNTGQQTDHRDELENKIRETLAESFEVLAIQFHEPDVQRLGAGREGWEQTPLAYLLLKPRDASIDRIPPLQVDMDFSDGQGMVILPVTSPVELLSARAAEPPARALKDLKIEQTLDARGHPTEPLRLEIRAEARGLVPPLDQLVSTVPPTGLRVAGIEDHGVNILRLDTEEAGVVPVTERSWTIEYQPAGAPALARSFTFPAPRLEAAADYKQYSDADIVAAAAAIPLPPGAGGLRPWQWAVAAVLAAGVFTALALIAARRRASRAAPPAPRFTLPPEVTPFSAIALLRRIEAANGEVLRPDEQLELSTTLADLERRFFGPAAPAAPPSANGDLHALLRTWVSRAGG